MKIQEQLGKMPLVTEDGARALIKLAERKNEKSGGCCSGPGTAGTEELKDVFLKPENQNKFKDLNARVKLSSYLNLNHQGVSKDNIVAQK